MMIMNVIAVVVTYNRYELLKECLGMFHGMSVKPSKVIVVDNASTDGTSVFLEQMGKDPLYKIVTLEKNIGGAGGFSYGIRLAVEEGCDWVWLMDDDTIPGVDSLELLCDRVASDSTIGFASSRVVWTDGNDHAMNIPKFAQGEEGVEGCKFLDSASFVSLMVRSSVVKNIGLPYKEFFIWVDDTEYTQRIVRAGYKGIFVNDSIVVHKTKDNYGPIIETAPVSTAWKFYYGQRNSMFLHRFKFGNGVWFFIKELNHLRLVMRGIGRRPKCERKVFKKFVKKGFWDGLFFKPKVEYV